MCQDVEMKRVLGNRRHTRRVCRGFHGAFALNRLVQIAAQNEEWHRFTEQLNVDVLVDLLGTDLPGTYHEAQNYAEHIIACGSFWMYGPPQIVPTPEETQNPCEFSDYSRRYQEILGIRGEAIHDGMSFTAIMPTNICGPGKIPIDLKGGRDEGVHQTHAAGKPLQERYLMSVRHTR
ncbi:MAG: hypothetical protein MAGBODY4_01292 [Candidatus Marinimicrobia bacterium]|nr:hypothetical protein [Candidatus Neomarinimicrobiota bacterium]